MARGWHKLHQKWIQQAEFYLESHQFWCKLCQKSFNVLFCEKLFQQVLCRIVTCSSAAESEALSDSNCLSWDVILISLSSKVFVTISSGVPFLPSTRTHSSNISVTLKKRNIVLVNNLFCRPYYCLIIWGIIKSRWYGNGTRTVYIYIDGSWAVIV